MNDSFEKGDFFLMFQLCQEKITSMPPLNLSYFVIIFCDHSWVLSKSHCLHTRRALRFGNRPVQIKERVHAVAHFSMLHIIITSELLSSRSLLRSSTINHPPPA